MRLKSVTLGLAAGFVGGLFGVGGGVIVVPGLLLWLRFDAHHASGTSVATIVASSAAALVSFQAAGSVDWAAAAWITAAAVLGAAFGARVMGSIPARTLRGLFAAIMLIAAARLAIS